MNLLKYTVTSIKMIYIGSIIPFNKKIKILEVQINFQSTKIRNQSTIVIININKRYQISEYQAVIAIIFLIEFRAITPNLLVSTVKNQKINQIKKIN